VSAAARRAPRDERRLALVRGAGVPERDRSWRRVAGGVALAVSLGASIVSAAVYFTLAGV
jgi:hypothetical protein